MREKMEKVADEILRGEDVGNPEDIRILADVLEKSFYQLSRTMPEFYTVDGGVNYKVFEALSVEAWDTFDDRYGDLITERLIQDLPKERY